MFLGEYFHSLDGKGRVVMPSGFRRRLEDGCVITKGRDGQLLIFASGDFEQKASEMIDQQPEDKGGRRFARTYFAGADLQTPDKSGRVIVKPDLRDYADLEPGNRDRRSRRVRPHRTVGEGPSPAREGLGRPELPGRGGLIESTW